MAVHAHLLLQVDPGRSQDAAQYLSGLPAVRDTAVTSGAYDVIATVEAQDDAALLRALALARRTPGLWAVRLCRRTPVPVGL